MIVRHGEQPAVGGAAGAGAGVGGVGAQRRGVRSDNGEEREQEEQQREARDGQAQGVERDLHRGGEHPPLFWYYLTLLSLLYCTTNVPGYPDVFIWGSRSNLLFYFRCDKFLEQ